MTKAPTKPAARVAIVEDHVLQLARTEELLQRQGFEVVFSGESLPAFVAWLRSSPPNSHPHLLVLDLMVERQPSVEVSLVASLLRAGLRIVVLSALASPPLVRSIVRAGVNGVIGKRDSEDDVLAAIRAVLRGETWMTTELAVIIAGDSERPRLSVQEERALVLYASDLTLKEVASAMNIGVDTAKQYLDRVKRKYAEAGVPLRSKLDLARMAWTEGYLDRGSP